MNDIDYQVRRSTRRRTVAIQIRQDCSVRVLAPARLSEERIREFVALKQRWISRTIDVLRHQRDRFRPKQYSTGEAFSYLGRTCLLQISHSGSGVALNGDRLIVAVPPDPHPETTGAVVREQLHRWYAARAQEYLTQRTRHFAHKMDCYPAAVLVKHYRSQWGCCYRDGRVMFNWRLILAAPAVIDYVIVHELAHLVHHNHSKAYWDFVAGILPDYRELRQWLKNCGRELFI